MSEFIDSAPSAPAVFYRSYSRRKPDGTRESYEEAITRTVNDLAEIGGFTEEQRKLCLREGLAQRAFPSGRALWVAGTEWAKKPENFYGYYNCFGGLMLGPEVFGRMMNLAMCGTGTGVVLEKEFVDRLPPVSRSLSIRKVVKNRGKKGGQEFTSSTLLFDTEDGCVVKLTVGDSRQGWVDAYQLLIDWALGADSEIVKGQSVEVELDLSQVRQKGERLKGFGGVANPEVLETAYRRVVALLAKAYGRKLTPIEACLLVDEAANAVVAGNVRRTAGMRIFSSDDEDAKSAKLGLYKQDEAGNWSVDPEREALRLANHTVAYHHRPTAEELVESVRSQFQSGEGAIQFAPEAIARSNADILDDDARRAFIEIYCSRGKEAGREYLKERSERLGVEWDEKLLDHRITRYSLNPCFAPGTMVMTRQGHYPIESLVGKTVEVFDGDQWVAIDNFRVTGIDQEVLRVELHSGLSYTVTPYHKFVLDTGEVVEARNLVEGQRLAKTLQSIRGAVSAKGAYLKGFLIAEGTHDRKTGIPTCKVYEPKRACVDRLVESQQEIGVRSLVAANGRRVGETLGLTSAGCLMNLNSSLEENVVKWCSVYKHEFPVEVFNWTDEAKADFLAGLFDGDGTVVDSENGFAYQISSISRNFLEGLLQLLGTLGVGGKIALNRKGGFMDFGPNRGGVCRVQDVYRLTISQASSIRLASLVRFERLKSFASRTVKYKSRDKSTRVISITPAGVAPAVYCCTVPTNHRFTLSSGIVTGQCSEIHGADFMCNLGEVHLNMIDPANTKAQHDAFYATGLMVGSLLQHKFPDEVLQYSREVDPIVAVCPTGIFDFFVKAFGTKWLAWMCAGRPNSRDGRAFTRAERRFLESWRESARQGVMDYCDQAGLKRPNRYTAVQPSGSKALLTGASSGWHPPKAQRFIRRITFGVDDPLVSALRDYGYSVIPAQSARDDDGNLLDDISDPRVREVLVEIPTEVSWANLKGADAYDLSKIPVEAQMGLYMQVQRHYSTHTTSATIEFREDEIERLAGLVHKEIQEDGGYIGVAMLARFDANETFPRLPFEPIDKATYDRMMAVVKANRAGLPKDITILELLKPYDNPDYSLSPQDTACANAACVAKAEQDEARGLS